MSAEKLFLYKRRNGYYYIGTRVSPTCIRWKTTKCQKKPEAIAFMRSFSFASAAPAEEKVNLTLSALLSIYSERQKHGMRPRSLQNNENAAKAFMNMFGDRELSLYTLANVEDFKNSFVNRGLCKVTANANFRGCKTIFNFAAKHGYLEKNVFNQSTQFKVIQKHPPFITAEDFRKLLAVVREPILKDLFQFAVLTGARLSEICNIRFSSIDLANQQVSIDCSDSFATKSGKSRTIPLNSRLVPIIQRLMSERQEGQEFLFSKVNGFRFEPGFISHRFKRYLRLAGLSEELHFHSLRHACASHLVSAGVSLYVVQRILGHSNIGTTTIYANLEKSSLHSAVNSLTI